MSQSPPDHSSSVGETRRHHGDHGWIIDGRYICDGCNVNGMHEHRCHYDHGGRPCECGPCNPTEDEMAAFRAELGLVASDEEQR